MATTRWREAVVPLHSGKGARSLRSPKLGHGLLMTSHKFSSSDFSRNIGAAMGAAVTGPVFITEQGRPAFVLLNIGDYYQLGWTQEAFLLDVMDAIPSGPVQEFSPFRLPVCMKTADFD